MLAILGMGWRDLDPEDACGERVAARIPRASGLRRQGDLVRRPNGIERHGQDSIWDGTSWTQAAPPTSPYVVTADSYSMAALGDSIVLSGALGTWIGTFGKPVDPSETDAGADPSTATDPGQDGGIAADAGVPVDAATNDSAPNIDSSTTPDASTTADVSMTADASTAVDASAIADATADPPGEATSRRKDGCDCEIAPGSLGAQVANVLVVGVVAGFFARRRTPGDRPDSASALSPQAGERDLDEPAHRCRRWQAAGCRQWVKTVASQLVGRRPSGTPRPLRLRPEGRGRRRFDPAGGRRPRKSRAGLG